METQELKAFFLWCTIINGVLLSVAIVGCILAPDWGFSMQSKLFHIPRETINIAIYSLLGVFKIFWLIFNVVPYVALIIIERK